MMKTLTLVTFWSLLMLTVLFSGCVQNALQPKDEIANIGEAVPNGWDYAVITQNLDEMPKLHGLWNPVAIVNFTNPAAEFERAGRVRANPSLLLYFYDISEKRQIDEIIRNESIFSWCIPINFTETARYAIVTSPCYINGGVFTDEAKGYYAPLEKSLKGYFGKFK